MKPIPLLFIGDSPELPTGLARIVKDLALLTMTLPEFRVGVFGRGGIGSAQLPFAQYGFPDSDQWGEGRLESAWDDFAGADRGIIMSVWDISRMTWFADPRMGGRLQSFLNSGRFQKWGYFPVDAYGIGGKLTGQSCDALQKYQRILAYSIFGRDVLQASTGRSNIDWLPHGFNGNKFVPRGKAAGRAILGIPSDVPLIGMVASNQPRKDWGTAFSAIARAKIKYPLLKFWVHTDVPFRSHAWDMRALTHDFGLANTVLLTDSGQFSSEELSYLYSSCDLTILSSLGEGFGYPIVESLACGTPVLHTNYAAGPQWIYDNNWHVHPTGERLEGLHNSVRPILDPVQWADKIEWMLENIPYGSVATECAESVSYLKWGNLWSGAWKKWFLSGIGK